jgi:hypothetical protein
MQKMSKVGDVGSARRAHACWNTVPAVGPPSVPSAHQQMCVIGGVETCRAARRACAEFLRAAMDLSGVDRPQLERQNICSVGLRGTIRNGAYQMG